MNKIMAHPNLLSSKHRNVRQWRLRNIITATFFGAAFLFYLVVFTPLGGSLAAPMGQKLLPSTGSDPRQRAKLVAQVELGRQAVKIDFCPAEMVDHMPCEDPRLNSQLSREMNFYRERHCPPVEQTPLCLIPPAHGYRVSVQWPESLHKVKRLYLLLWLIPFIMQKDSTFGLVEFIVIFELI